jgi:TPR repeat protein
MLSDERRSVRTLRPLVLASLALIACQHGRPDGRVGWTDEEHALESSCQAGNRVACRDLGALLIQDKRPGKDLERGLVLLEIACGGDDFEACGILGEKYADFRGPRGQKAQLGRALDLLGRACAHRMAMACTRQGQAIALDKPSNLAAMAAAFRAGCELGDSRGCELLAVLEGRFGEGRFGGPDTIEAEPDSSEGAPETGKE